MTFKHKQNFAKTSLTSMLRTNTYVRDRGVNIKDLLQITKKLTYRAMDFPEK